MANFVIIHTHGSFYEKMPIFQTNFSVDISIFTKLVLLLISNFHGVMNVVFFLLGVPQRLNFVLTFRNILYHPHRRCKQEE
jgi:hypothetical protein